MLFSFDVYLDLQDVLSGLEKEPEVPMCQYVASTLSLFNFNLELKKGESEPIFLQPMVRAIIVASQRLRLQTDCSFKLQQGV